MPDTQYSYSVDLENLSTSHSQAVLLVTPGSTVLDIGAADGSVARPLATRGCRVWGIEQNAAAAAKARGVCEQVIVGDVETLDLNQAVEGRKFDFVLLLDVLEHLRDPLAVLERAREQLVPGGRVIASIPNVTHGAVRLSLMSGDFTYTETGLLDRTHLRFFDRRTAETLFADAKLRIVERLRVTRGLNETEIPVDLSSVPPALLQKLEGDPDATTYQFVFAGMRADSEHVPEGASLAERLQRRTDQLESQYRQVEAYARALEQQTRGQGEALERATTELTATQGELLKVRSELDRLGFPGVGVADAVERERAQLWEVKSELTTRMSELSQRHLELRHLQADLAVKEAFITELRQSLAAAKAETDSTLAMKEESDRLLAAAEEAVTRAAAEKQKAIAELRTGAELIRAEFERQLQAAREQLRESEERLRASDDQVKAPQDALAAASAAEAQRRANDSLLVRIARRVAGG